MGDIRAFFAPLAAAAADSAPVAIPSTRGRPPSGPGCRGGQYSSVARDEKSRIRKRKTTDDDDQFDPCDEPPQPAEPPRKKAKASTRVNWSLPENQDRIAQAIALQERGFDYRTIEATTGVSTAVLHRRVHKKVALDAKVGVPTSLSSDEEKALVSFVLEMADRGFGKDVIEVRQIAKCMSKNPNFKATTQWWKRLRRRHPELSRRRGQGFERLRAHAMNPSLIQQYFLILTSAFAKIQELSGGMSLEAKRIYNMDECGFQLNAGKPYFVARRGTKLAASISFNCRVTTSLAVTVSASGFVLPPFFIVKGQRAPPQYLGAAPPGSGMAMAKKGMMTEEVFEQWVDHFVGNLESRDEKHWCLLLLDGHPR